VVVVVVVVVVMVVVVVVVMMVMFVVESICMIFEGVALCGAESHLPRASGVHKQQW
jgi:hypothetical protein